MKACETKQVKFNSVEKDYLDTMYRSHNKSVNDICYKESEGPFERECISFAGSPECVHVPVLIYRCRS